MLGIQGFLMAICFRILAPEMPPKIIDQAAPDYAFPGRSSGAMRRALNVSTGTIFYPVSVSGSTLLVRSAGSFSSGSEECRAGSHWAIRPISTRAMRDVRRAVSSPKTRWTGYLSARLDRNEVSQDLPTISTSFGATMPAIGNARRRSATAPR